MDLPTIGPWIPGVIALAQPWLIALSKKLRKGRIELYETGSIQIGYSDLGPTIALTGTLRCIGKDIFIKQITLQVTRKRDAAQHNFSWHAFRSNQIALGDQKNAGIELATSFLCTTTQPHRYNIVFTENTFLSEYGPKVQPFIQEWRTFINNKLADNATFSIDQSVFKEFSDTGKVVDTYTLLDRAFYWEEGAYQLRFIVQAANPDRSFPKVWEFVLSREESARIRINTIAILQNICGVNAIYNFGCCASKPGNIDLTST